MNWLAGAFAALAVCGSALPVAAQPGLRPQDLAGWSIVPAIQTLGVYENNLLVSAATQSEGAFARVTPSLEARYRGQLGFFSAGYSFDSDRHTRALEPLDDVFARQFGVVSFSSQPSERFSISGRTSYLSTQRPEEALDAAGLVVLSNRRTTRFSAGLATAHKISEASHANFEYRLTVDDYGQATEAHAGAATMLHALTSSITFRKAERTTWGIEHIGRILVGEDRTVATVTRGTYSSNTVGLQWTRDLTSNLKAVGSAGPRLSQTVPATIDPAKTTATNWELRPELLGSLTYRMHDQTIGVAYGRTQMLGFGATGFVDTQSVEVRSTVLAGRRLQLTARPGLYRNSLAGVSARSYRVDATAHYPLSRWMSVDAVFSHRYQDKALGIADFAVTSVAKSRSRTRVAVGATLQRPIRME